MQIWQSLHSCLLLLGCCSLTTAAIGFCKPCLQKRSPATVHMQNFETYTDFPRYFGLTMDVAGLKTRLDGGHCVVSGSALAFLSRAANNVKIKVC